MGRSGSREAGRPASAPRRNSATNGRGEENRSLRERGSNSPISPRRGGTRAREGSPRGPRQVSRARSPGLAISPRVRCTPRGPRDARRRPRSAAARRRTAGFTLVEMLAVVLVMGVAAAVAVPALRPSDEQSAGAAAERCAPSTARRARPAARRGEPVRVELETATDSFAIIAEPEGGARGLLRAGRLPLPEDASIAGGRDGRARARFTPAGPRPRGPRDAEPTGRIASWWTWTSGRGRADAAP